MRRSPNVSFNKSIMARAVCDMSRRLVGTTAPGHHGLVNSGMKKLVIMALYRSPLTVTLWPSSFLKKDSTSPKAHQTVQFFLDVTMFRHTLVD
ncbi:hypothetical protein TNCV_2566351 [Trichonephila clavipes]|nr:hypothetical protein TNCV_2566351 [Trichonephila clavipes]